MRHALILLNLILVLLLCGSVFRLVRRNTAGEKTVYTVKKRTGKGTTAVRSSAISTVKKQETVRWSPEESRKLLMEKNIFDISRCPASVTGSVRTTMNLVGTFRVGNTQGAVILQKGTTGSTGFAGGPPPMMGGGGRRQGFSTGGRNSRQGGRGTGTQGMNMPPPPGMMNQFTAGNQNQNKSTAAKHFKQYIRVGETLENGYKLVEVTRRTAVLTRGGEKIELEIQDASKNAPAAASRNSRRSNPTQQALQNVMQGLQNMQRQQGFQNMQMMRMMQQNMNNQPAGGNGGRRRR